MAKYVFDLETDGFLDVCTKVHAIVLKDIDTKERHTFVQADVPKALDLLNSADLIVGHNVIKFDLPVLKKLYGFSWDKAKVRDTMVLARLCHSDIKAEDGQYIKTGQLPGPLYGKHTLEAWGYRLGNYKGDFEGPWEVCTPTMIEYCEQDVEVTLALYERLVASGVSEDAITLEMDVAHLCAQIERNGFPLNIERAGKLYGHLAQRREELRQELTRLFDDWYVSAGEFTPKRDNKKSGYTAGVPFTKIKLQEFNPGSRQMIADRLKWKYRWKPEVFTDKGQVKIDETILST